MSHCLGQVRRLWSGVILAILGSLALACTSNSEAPTVAPGTPTAPATPTAPGTPVATGTPAASGTPAGTVTTTIIDWVDFVQLDGITYVRTTTALDAADIEDRLGPQLAEVEFTLSGNVFDTSYRFEDRDAAFLATGTPLYALQGYATTFRIAARAPVGVLIYEVDTNLAATTGSDLLDLEGKVTSITLRHVDGTDLASIQEASAVADLVRMILEAPVDQTFSDRSGDAISIVFHLTDGEEIARPFWPESGELQRGIRPAEAFTTAVKDHLEAAR